MSESAESAYPSYVVDSDVLIDHLRGYQCARDFFEALLLDGARVCFSVVSEAEIYSNVRAGEGPTIRAFFDSLCRLDVDGRVARKAGAYRAQYLRSHGLALPDALIAAAAFVHGADLVTRNERHYPMTDFDVVVPYDLADLQASP